MVNFQRKERYDWEDLLTIMRILRAPGGCPWDREQTHESLRRNFLEESCEVVEAIYRGDRAALCEELGDALLQVVFHAQLEKEQGGFTMDDVVDGICKKLVYRHPHVFSTTKVADAEQVSENWEMLKAKEKGGNKRILSGIPDAMPPILKAFSMQDKARGVGFDWEEKSQVWDKVKEEQMELQAEMDAMDSATTEEERKAATDRAEEELGDFMFATINAARLYGLNPDTALNRACDKFRRRFTYLEENTIRKGKDLHQMTLAEMDEIWDEGKAKGL